MAFSAMASHFILADSITGSNMDVLIQSSIHPTIDERVIAAGDEIAVFDSAGLCCGVRIWPSSGSTSITVWGQNPNETTKDGMNGSELLRWRVWDAVLAKESPAKVAYFPRGSGIISDSLYVDNGISELASLVSVPSAVLPRSISGAVADFSVSGNALHYSLTRPEAVRFTFFNLLGKSALDISRNELAGNHQLDLKRLPLVSGRYVVRFQNGALSREVLLFLKNGSF
jgi:hypothetical protein